MKIKVIALVIILIAIIAFLVIRFLPGQKPKQAGLQVSSSPRSTVFLDDKHVGQTPYYDEKLKPGDYTVKLMPDTESTQSSPWVSKIKLNPETLTVIDREFGNTQEESSGFVLSMELIGKNKEPELAVLVKPNDAKIKIDGDYKGNAPLIISTIKEGDHEIEVSSDNYVTKKVKVELAKGYRLTASIDLAKNTGATKAVTPTASPTGKLSPTPIEEPENQATSAAESKLKIGGKIIVTETPTGWLNVRPDASTDGSPSAQVNPGQEFTVLEIKPDWVKIEYESGKEGWVSTQYVTNK